MGRIVYLNGDYLPEEEARVSIFDRGFLFGDGAYEVVPVMDGMMVDVEPFLVRLENSLRELQLDWPCSKDEYLAMHGQLIARNNLKEGMIYSQVTRGVADRQFYFPENTKPTLMAFTQVVNHLSNPAVETGVKVVSVHDIRWKRRDIKSIALLAQCMAKQAAHEKGAAEGWMIEDGYVTEGTSSSAYIVKDGVLITRPLNNTILAGIRRKLLLKLAREHQIRVEERPFTLQEAFEADEAMMSAASFSVLPIVEIDGNKIGDGKPGRVFARLRALYLENARENGVIVVARDQVE
jgi:D-alanine transaminase